MSIDTVKFLEHVIIQQMQAPSNILFAELRRFLGMVSYLGKFASHLSNEVKPLRDLLSTKNEWTWSDSQQNDFSQELSNAPVLVLYDSTMIL